MRRSSPQNLHKKAGTQQKTALARKRSRVPSILPQDPLLRSKTKRQSSPLRPEVRQSGTSIRQSSAITPIFQASIFQFCCNHQSHTNLQFCRLSSSSRGSPEPFEAAKTDVRAWSSTPTPWVLGSARYCLLSSSQASRLRLSAPPRQASVKRQTPSFVPALSPFHSFTFPPLDCQS